MSLITRCPACGTMFKVVADQLKISDGWVRCGHCAEIFDAAADLRGESAMQTPASSSGFGNVPEPSKFEEQAPSLKEDARAQPVELRRTDSPEAEPVGPYRYSQPTSLEPEPELHDLTFVRQALRKEFWKRPAVRGVLALLLVLMVASLAAQIAYRDHDRLALAAPRLRPWLARMCDVMRCRVGPPLQIESIAIETSSFNKLRGDSYRLNVTLRNVAANEVAMPSLELTLTDAQDQPVVRRVLQPADFAPGRAAMPATGDWSTSVALAVNANAAAGRIAGYRLLAFYP